MCHVGFWLRRLGNGAFRFMVARDLKSRKRSAIAEIAQPQARLRDSRIFAAALQHRLRPPPVRPALVGGIAAQGDKIRDLGGIDAIPRANLGGADTCHLAGAEGIKDGGMVRGELERIAVAARNEDCTAALLLRGWC